MGHLTHPLHRTAERLLNGVCTHVSRDALFGALSGASILVPALWWGSVVGIAWLASQVLTRPPHRAAKSALVFTVSAHALAYVGFWGLYPFDWLGVGGGISIAAITLHLLVLCTVPALVIAGAAALAASLRTEQPFADTIFFASVYTLASYAGLWAQSLAFAGNEWLPGPHLSVALPGYALSHTPPLLPLAAFGGAYALTFVVALSAAATSRSLATACTVRTRALAFTVAMFLAGGAALAPHTKPAGTLDVALITTYAQTSTAGVEAALAAMDSAAPLIVTPEESALSARIPELRAAPFLLDSAPGETEAGKRTRRMTLYERGILSDTYDKRYLTPGGEYEPWLFASLTARLDSTGALSLHRRTRGEYDSLFTVHGTVIAAQFCSEILSPSLYRDAAKSGAALFVNVASHAWFHSSPAIEASVIAATKVRAAESGRFVATAGAETPSTVSSDDGRIVARAREGETSVTLVSVPLKAGATPYVLFGDWVLLPLLAGVIAPLILKRQESPQGAAKAVSPRRGRA